MSVRRFQVDLKSSGGTARQDFANLSAALHEMSYQILRPFLGLMVARGLRAEHVKPWVAWRMERDGLL